MTNPSCPLLVADPAEWAKNLSNADRKVNCRQFRSYQGSLTFHEFGKRFRARRRDGKGELVHGHSVSDC